MNKTLFTYIFFALSMIILPSKAQDDNYDIRQSRTQWFQQARFGMFIHWGIYSVPARGEWVRNKEEISNEAYQVYFDQFDPVNYNPKEWARLAKKAGMKYAVLTAKHHDGFCLFDSKFTDYKATNTKAKRDLVREYIDAFRAEGLKVGLYYSLVDWHHPDYPAYGDYCHPMRNNPEWKDKKHNFDNYVKYLHNQVEELVTNYGKIDIMWFDFSYDKMWGEAWQATKLVNMIRKKQPDIILNNRLGGQMESEHPQVYAGDFEGPEQYIPEYGVFDFKGRRLPWEACLTLNNSWGYAQNDYDFKSPEFIIKTMANCVSKGGNLLLNVGPDAKGVIPDESKQIILKVGEWLEKHGESIYGCGPADIPKSEWGYITQKGDTLYAHIVNQGIGHYCLPTLKGKIQNATMLTTGAEVFVSDWWLGREASFIKKDDIFINFHKAVQETYPLPYKSNTVVKIVLKKK